MVLGWKAKQDIDPAHWEGGGNPIAEALPGVQLGSASDDPLAHAQSILGGGVPNGVSSSSPAEARTPPPSPIAAFADHIAVLDADAIVEIITGVDQMVMTGIAAGKDFALPREVILEAIEIPPKDIAKLKRLAPYAAKYAPLITKYAEPVLAVLFVGFWGLSMTMRVKQLDMLERRYQEGNHGIGNPSPN